ncbi:ABC1 kinase family protein [Bdellovibrio bacteriovorus]|uniref:ABC1 kinase family protein n=1 Tax=Bdellovibrio bacteriovorus TaxID=959 RepID=UPI0035A633D6
MGSIFNSQFKRTFELAKMATKIGLKELSSGDIQSRIEQAKILTETLGNLRGAAMKAGQLLSLDLDDYFPPEAIQILSQLQNQAFDSPELDLTQVLKDELNQDQLRQLQNINYKPFAAASMGQVYKASVANNPVVIKAQYPHLEQSIENDVKALKRLMSTLCLLTGRNMNLEHLFIEIEEVLRQEVNYLNEARALSKFSELFESHDWNHARIRTPKPLLHLSTNKVLCLTYEQGLTLKEWIDTRPPLEKREIIAKALLELYVMEFFVWGFVQTDPNPGNFLIRQTPDLEVVALDFGASRHYPADFRRNYIELLHAIRSPSPGKIVQKAIEFGLLDSRESEEAKTVFVALLKLGMSPFFQDSDSRKFNFKNDQFVKENARLSRQLVQSLKYSPPPHKLIFLHRKLGGMFAALRKLEVELDLSEYWNKIETADILS